jgi:hypothetical protein
MSIYMCVKRTGHSAKMLRMLRIVDSRDATGNWCHTYETRLSQDLNAGSTL